MPIHSSKDAAVNRYTALLVAFVFAAPACFAEGRTGRVDLICDNLKGGAPQSLEIDYDHKSFRIGGYNYNDPYRWDDATIEWAGNSNAVWIDRRAGVLRMCYGSPCGTIEEYQCKPNSNPQKF